MKHKSCTKVTSLVQLIANLVICGAGHDSLGAAGSRKPVTPRKDEHAHDYAMFTASLR